MRKALLVSLVGLVALVALAGAAQAQISASVHVKDINGNLLDNATVPLNTKCIVYGHYDDLAGNSPGTGKIDVYLDTGSGFSYIATIWGPSIVTDGQTISVEFIMTQLGTYQFRWTVRLGTGDGCVETAQARTTIHLTTPEPATIAGLAMSLSALGLFAYRRKRKQ